MCGRYVSRGDRSDRDLFLEWAERLPYRGSLRRRFDESGVVRDGLGFAPS
jgi:hypothetical protein